MRTRNRIDRLLGWVDMWLLRDQFAPFGPSLVGRAKMAVYSHIADPLFCLLYRVGVTSRKPVAEMTPEDLVGFAEWGTVREGQRQREGP